MTKFQLLSLAALLLTSLQHADAGVISGRLHVGGDGYGGGGGVHGGSSYGGVYGGVYEDGYGGGEGHGGKAFVSGHVAHPKHYFKYEVSDPQTGDYHSQKESAEDGKVKGEYVVKDSKGNFRTVKYHADDKSGFQAVVMNSEIRHPSGQGIYGGGGKGSTGGSGYGGGSRYGVTFRRYIGGHGVDGGEILPGGEEHGVGELAGGSYLHGHEFGGDILSRIGGGGWHGLH